MVSVLTITAIASPRQVSSRSNQRLDSDSSRVAATRVKKSGSGVNSGDGSRGLTEATSSLVPGGTAGQG